MAYLNDQRYTLNMRTDKESALKMRKQGYSYGEINKILGIPKSTLSGWLNGIILSETARSRLQKKESLVRLENLNKRNRQQTHAAQQRAKKIRASAMKDIGSITPENLLIIGSALYWAEGYKKVIIKNGKERTYHPISLTNTDPTMVRLFIKFLVDIVEIPKTMIRANLRLFKHINEMEALKYWQQITDLPKDNFEKPCNIISKSSLGKRPFNRLPYGVIQIRVNNTAKFHKIMGWIEGLKKQFNN